MSSNLQSKNQIAARQAVKPKLVLAGAPVSETPLLNRELSLVEFFRHVLEHGLDGQIPLLERLRFLIIFSNIVDEFFMVRVSGLKEEVEEGWVQPSPDGMTAEEQLREIRSRLRPMVAEQSRALRENILPELERAGIAVASYDSLSGEERAQLDNYFTRNVFPVLTP